MPDSLMHAPRQALRALLHRLATSEHGWAILRCTPAKRLPFVVRTRRAYESRKHLESLTEAAIAQVADELTVLNGPFAGLRYPTATSIGSRLFPKLLGTYESELHSLIEGACKITYSRVLDIGCAEGYYAVGLARRIPNATIYAYDTNPTALTACRALAAMNGVQNRCVLSGECTREALRLLANQPRSLIISDCEGYEDHLFAADVIPSLRGHDCLIETHDFLGQPILERLLARFRPSHDCTVVPTTTDAAKLCGNVSGQLGNFTEADQRLLVSEGRPGPMTWLFAASRGT